MVNILQFVLIMLITSVDVDFNLFLQSFMTNLGYEVATNSVVALLSWKLFHLFSKLENGLQFVNITSKKVDV